MSYDPNAPSQPSYPPPPANYGNAHPGAYPTTTASGNGMATAAMVLGIVGLVLIWLPIVSIIGIIAGVVGLVLGIIALRRANAGGGKRGQAIAGIVCSAITVVLFVIAVAVVGSVIASNN